ncbi:hypothetical protein EVAR_52420_1 [Eumeta japonica]|uniref:DUF4371 domain-containing protein n=1 Tax=Eumeta variegata TaxID=151549 RepID=A0A4C1YFN7_EUMVA|nr:hypothetical protein EVAR_52420_1 [Eumeta japonica]
MKRQIKGFDVCCSNSSRLLAHLIPVVQVSTELVNEKINNNDQCSNVHANNLWAHSSRKQAAGLTAPTTPTRRQPTPVFSGFSADRDKNRKRKSFQERNFDSKTRKDAQKKLEGSREILSKPENRETECQENVGVASTSAALNLEVMEVSEERNISPLEEDFSKTKTRESTAEEPESNLLSSISSCLDCGDVPGLWPASMTNDLVNILNEIIDLLGTTIKNYILNKVRESKYFSIILDCTPDVSHTEQITVILSKMMQNPTINTQICINLLNKLIDKFTEYRTDEHFERVLEEATNVARDLNVETDFPPIDTVRPRKPTQFQYEQSDEVLLDPKTKYKRELTRKVRRRTRSPGRHWPALCERAWGTQGDI